MSNIYESLAGQLLAIAIKQFFPQEKQKQDKIFNPKT